MKNKTALIVVTVSALHFLTFIASFIVSFGSMMERFDAGQPATRIETIVRWVSEILGFPLLTHSDYLPSQIFPGLWGYIPVVLNSLLWGCAGFLIFRVFGYRNVARTRHKPKAF